LEIQYEKIRNKKCHTVGTVPKSNRTITERDKIHTPKMKGILESVLFD
jgi:hypothetical protein